MGFGGENKCCICGVIVKYGFCWVESSGHFILLSNGNSAADRWNMKYGPFSERLPIGCTAGSQFPGPASGNGQHICTIRDVFPLLPTFRTNVYVFSTQTHTTPPPPWSYVNHFAVKFMPERIRCFRQNGFPTSQSRNLMRHSPAHRRRTTANRILAFIFSIFQLGC